ncbi:MAG: DUF3305 domain-containing protein [Burkholderiales bacterium]|nr:DUF3305 domain-containing protein [Burkholderiales bacterium]
MLPIYFSVDVLMDRIPLANRWISEQWQPASIIPVAEGALVPGVPECVADGPERTTWRFPRMPIELHPTEAEGYFLNLTSDTPIVFVMWRFSEDGSEPAAYPEIVTLSYNQAGRYMDGGERVDPVPLPDPIRAWLAAFVALHYKPEPKRKVRRNDPFRDGAFVRDRPRGGHGR